MDAADIARADLRSYALRRCIRFYAAILVFVLAVTGSVIVKGDFVSMVSQPAAVMLAILVLVEIASGVTMTAMAKVRDASPGPETGLWRFAQGPHPSWIAATFFAGLATYLWTMASFD